MMPLFRWSGAMLAVVLCAAGPALCADWKFSSSFNYDTGKYGTQDRARSIYIPFTLKRYFDNSDLSITVPWIWLSSNGQVTWVGGRPTRAARTPPVRPPRSAESGFGDILLRAAYGLLRDGPRSCDLALAGKFKLPTASHAKGLGTGEPDWGPGLEFSKKISKSATLIADAYYLIIGHPSGITYKDQITFDAGLSVPLKKELVLIALYENRSAILSGTPSARAVSAALLYDASAGTQVFGGLSSGISDGSPDLGFSGGFSFKY